MGNLKISHSWNLAPELSVLRLWAGAQELALYTVLLGDSDAGGRGQVPYFQKRWTSDELVFNFLKVYFEKGVSGS